MKTLSSAIANPDLVRAKQSRVALAGLLRRPAPRNDGDVLDKLLRILLTALHGVLKLNWFVRRPRTFGAHALAFTPEGKAILVRLRYAPGWRLPGGGRAEDEDPREAVLRELREEIGMVSHGEVRLAAELEDAADHKRDLAALLIVRDVCYQPRRWSWEVEAILETRVDDLPAGLSPRAARWLEALKGKI
jgi:ADP-ribose pyrophosphatase YjhB (NUDIX family)